VARLLAKGGETDLPWHRVLRAGWQIAFPIDSEGFREQRRRLLAEGHQVKGRRVLSAPAAETLDQALWGP
jgi:methylated-DNA-protein-cysteine methyltransferase-like protein